MISLTDKILLIIKITQAIALAAFLVLFVTGQFVLRDMQLVYISFMLMGLLGVLVLTKDWLERRKSRKEMTNSEQRQKDNIEDRDE